MVLDYSQTINRFRDLTYPALKIQITAAPNMISVAFIYAVLFIKFLSMKMNNFIQILKLVIFNHFKRIPFGVTNEIAAFKRTLDNIIRKKSLKDTFAYLGYQLVCGTDKHDINLQSFIKLRKI